MAISTHRLCCIESISMHHPEHLGLERLYGSLNRIPALVGLILCSACRLFSTLFRIASTSTSQLSASRNVSGFCRGRSELRYKFCYVIFCVLLLIFIRRYVPLKIKQGRVIGVHPSSDEVVRVVTIKTSKGTYKRPVSKVCLLPDSED